jgi:hypothetical protein
MDPAGQLALDRASQSVEGTGTGLSVPINPLPTAGCANGPTQPDAYQALLGKPTLIGTVPDPFHGSSRLSQPLLIRVRHPTGLEATTSHLHLATLGFG